MMSCLQVAPRRFTRQMLAATSVRTNTTIAETVFYRVNYHDKDATALVCPKENVKWSYTELSEKISELAGGLKSKGYGHGDIIATDLQHGVGNVLLQLALSWNGMQVVPVKDAKEFDQVAGRLPVAGAVMGNSSSFLSKVSIAKSDVITEIKGKASEGNTDRRLDLAYYDVNECTTNRNVYIAGIGMAGLLGIKAEDKVCIAMSPNQLVGMGSIVSAFLRNATVYIPDMQNLDLADSTLVITDEGSLDKLREVAKGPKLRGGVVKTSGGDAVLWATENVAGVDFRILGAGSNSEIMRPLYDSCKDTYYSHK